MHWFAGVRDPKHAAVIEGSCACEMVGDHLIESTLSECKDDATVEACDELLGERVACSRAADRCEGKAREEASDKPADHCEQTASAGSSSTKEKI